jgi:hypothetical protein
MGITWGGNSRSSIGPACLLARRLSNCCGSSGRPGCSFKYRRCSRNGTFGGGGALLVIKPGGTVLGEPWSEPIVEGKGFAFEEVGGSRSALAGGAEFRFTSGGGVRASPGADRIVGGFAAARAETTGTPRTGGAVTSLPGRAALTLGVTVGWGIT